MSVEPLLTDWVLYERPCSDCAVTYQLEHINAAAGVLEAPDESWWHSQIERHCATLPDWLDLTADEIADVNKFVRAVMTDGRVAS